MPFLIEISATNARRPRAARLAALLAHFLPGGPTNAIMLAEANLDPDQNISDYFGKRTRGIHMLFNFSPNQHLFLALAPSAPIRLVEPPSNCRGSRRRRQWGNFLRNHDELDLGRLSEEDRERSSALCPPEGDAAVRSRHPPSARADARRRPRRLELAYSLCCAAGHAGHLLWRRDRHGRGPLARGAQQPCARRCSGREQQRRVLNGSVLEARAPGDLARGPSAIGGSTSPTSTATRVRSCTSFAAPSAPAGSHPS